MKHYTPGDEARLIDEVEAQGGRYLAGERHTSDEIDDLKLPDMGPPLSTGCEEDALFLVAYEPFKTVEVNEPILEDDPDPSAPSGRKRQRKAEDGTPLYEVVERGGTGDGGEAVLATVQVCANDDLMRNWPRFQHRMKNHDPLTGNR